MEHKIGILLWEPLIVRFGLRRTFRKLLEIGFDSFEIVEKYDYTNEDIKFLLKQKRAHNLTYTLHSSSPGGYINLLTTNIKYFVPRVMMCIKMARTLQAELITFDIDSYQIEKSEEYMRNGMLCLHALREKLYKIARENIRTIIKHANRHEIKVAIEIPDVRDINVRRLKIGASHSGFRRLIHNIKDLYVTLDTGHLYTTSNYFKFDMFKFIDDFFKKIIHAHINDNFGLEDGTGFKTPKYGDLHLPLGMGTLPLEKIIKKLKKSGYGGIWMLEIKPLRVTDDERKVWKLIEDSYKKLKAKV